MVNGVTSFGIFVQLDSLFIEGLVHVTELGSDYFQYDEIKNELRGERTGIRYRLSDRVRVQVSRVDLDARKIDFRLVRDTPIKPPVASWRAGRQELRRKRRCARAFVAAGRRRRGRRRRGRASQEGGAGANRGGQGSTRRARRGEEARRRGRSRRRNRRHARSAEAASPLEPRASGTFTRAGCARSAFYRRHIAVSAVWYTANAGSELAGTALHSRTQARIHHSSARSWRAQSKVVQSWHVSRFYTVFTQ